MFSSLEMPKADLWVLFAIVSTVIGYIAKTYFTYVFSYQSDLLNLFGISNVVVHFCYVKAMMNV